MAENEEMVIINHYKQLDEKSRVEVRDKILEETGMAHSTFYIKLNGISHFKKAEIKVINQILGLC